MTDARERRRARAETAKKTNVGATIKKFRIPILILLIWAAVVGFNVAQAEGVIASKGESCPGHWHSTFDVYVDGQKVAFTANPAYTLEGGQGMGIRTHMHRGAEGIWHFEPPTIACGEMVDAMDLLDMKVSSTAMTLSGGYHDVNGWGGTHTVDGNNSLHILYKEFDGEWTEMSASAFNKFQPLDGSQILIVYGSEDAAALATLQSTGTTSLPENLTPQGYDAGPGNFIAITMASIFALLALLIWYNFAKKTW